MGSLLVVSLENNEATWAYLGREEKVTPSQKIELPDKPEMTTGGKKLLAMMLEKPVKPGKVERGTCKTGVTGKVYACYSFLARAFHAFICPSTC